MTQVEATKPGRPALLAALSVPSFRLLWVGQSLSLVGDFVHQVALLVLIYRLTGSGIALGGLFALQALPTLLGGTAGGVVADRYDRRLVMILADIARCLAVSALVLWPTVPVAYATAIAVASASALFGPARAALVPELVPPPLLLAANSASAFTASLARIGGTALGALLVGALGVRVAFGLNALTFALSAFFVLLIRRSILGRPVDGICRRLPASPSQGGDGSSPRESFWTPLRNGLEPLARIPALGSLVALAFTTTLGLSAANVLTAPLVQDVLRADTSSLGWLMSAEGFGAAVAVALLGSFLRTAAAGWCALGAAVLLALLLVGLGLVQTLNTAVLLFLAGGMSLVVFNVASETEAQRLTDPSTRGRVMGVIISGLAAANLTSLLLGGILVDIIGVRPTFLTMGMIVLLGCVLCGPKLVAKHPTTTVQSSST